jgi:hypothetical protein
VILLASSFVSSLAADLRPSSIFALDARAFVIKVRFDPNALDTSANGGRSIGAILCVALCVDAAGPKPCATVAGRH